MTPMLRVAVRAARGHGRRQAFAFAHSGRRYVSTGNGGQRPNLFSLLTTRLVSKIYSIPFHTKFPKPLLGPLLRVFCYLFGIKATEAELELGEYTSLADFFTRKLKPGCREIDVESELASPCDGKILSCGEVTDGLIPQIKGWEFPEDEFLLREDGKAGAGKLTDGRKRMYCVIYLSPGDYHRFHAPTQFKVTDLAHAPGTLYPVHTLSRRLVSSLFCQNERVVMEGKWKFGQFAMAAVAAFGVGDVHLNHDSEVACNRWEDNQRDEWVKRKKYPNPQEFQKGQDLGYFTFGSTIVLLFDAPAEFRFSASEKIQMGQALGSTAAPVKTE